MKTGRRNSKASKLRSLINNSYDEDAGRRRRMRTGYEPEEEGERREEEKEAGKRSHPIMIMRQSNLEVPGENEEEEQRAVMT